MSPIYATNGIAWRSLPEYRAAARLACDALEPIRIRGIVRPGEIVAFVTVRNELEMIEPFLAHYRMLGVSRFIFVDNASVDGTRELLLRQPDVELYLARASYAEANFGSLWIDGLAVARALGHWIVVADIDELLVYDGCDFHSLHDLAQVLASQGSLRLFAPMLDMYPPGPLSDYQVTSDRKLWNVFSCFDAFGERQQRFAGGFWMKGGARSRWSRLYDAMIDPALSKFPFGLYDEKSAYCSIHGPQPPERNFGRAFGRLLHFKLTNRFAEKVRAGVSERQHWNDSTEYEAYDRYNRADPNFSFVNGTTKFYKSPRTLIDLALLEAIDWSTCPTIC